MPRHYVPEAGDIVWLHSSAGHEQAGHRRALVISPATYNGKTGLMLCCPMTSQIKGYPFEVLIEGTRPSVALSDQVKRMDWIARRATRKGRISSAELAAVRGKIASLIGNSKDVP